MTIHHSQLADRYDTIDEILADMKGWSHEMEFNLSPSPDDEPNYIDLCSILKGNKTYKLPQHFKGILDKKKLITALKISAIKSGFGLVHRSSKSMKQLEKSQSNTAAYLTLQCTHGLTYKGKEKTFDLVSKTKWSRQCDIKCRFRINISLDKHSNSWFVHNNKLSNQEDHMGHFKMDSSHIHTSLNMLPPEEIEMAKEGSQLNMTDSNTASLINIRDVLGVNNNWTRHQIFYQNRKHELNTLNSTASEYAKASSAEKLICMFQAREDTNFLYLTYEPSEGLMLMTGKDRSKKSISTTLKKDLMTMYTNNALTTNGKLLVLFLFNNKKEMRLARMHPESWQVCCILYVFSYISLNILIQIYYMFFCTIVYTFVVTFV